MHVFRKHLYHVCMKSNVSLEENLTVEFFCALSLVAPVILFILIVRPFLSDIFLIFSICAFYHVLVSFQIDSLFPKLKRCGIAFITTLTASIIFRCLLSDAILHACLTCTWKRLTLNIVCNRYRSKYFYGFNYLTKWIVVERIETQLKVADKNLHQHSSVFHYHFWRC